jgi:glycosyl hydrolase family 9/cellulase-like Ig domain-containing protein
MADQSRAEPSPNPDRSRHPQRHGLHRARPGTVHARFSRPGLAVVAASLLGLVAWGCGSGGDADQAARTAGAAAGGPGTVAAAVRVDQLGFTPQETKTAYLLTASRGPSSFAVVDDAGRTVLSGRAKASRGRWNRRYRAVRPLDLTALRAWGTYRIRVAGITSAPFRVAPSAELFGPRIDDAVAFFSAQRDGANVVPGPLHRRPAHLRDRHARVYHWPRYESPGSDVIVGRSLRPIGGHVDLEGGWVDAGDFIKFTHTTAYAETLLLAARRALGDNAPASLAPETRFGLHWLGKAWDQRRGVMYIQVGIGSGNKSGTFRGDHDLWRLPQRDDTLTGAPNRYLRNRPAFRANRPGKPVPPNLAGRVAAAYALAAQLDAGAHPPRAKAELAHAAAVFGAAKTSHVRPRDVVTALPHAFYPESSWRDDLELGAAELALAGQALHDPRADHWLRAAARWAKAYLRTEAGDDTMNLYDTSALAHADLVRAIRAAAGPPGLAITQTRLIADLRAQLERGVGRAAHDPFRAGVVYDNFDAAPHAFGLVATARLYRALTGDTRYDGFATSQRDWALGDNAWGVSLMVGVGRDFPHCMQHVVANLSGSVDGGPPLLRGAVVNGPNDSGLFSDGLGSRFSTMRRCPPHGGDRYAAFSGHGSRFVDDVRSWQTVEPAIDFTAAASLAFALLR